MAYEDMGKVVALGDTRLSASDFAVLVVLASHRNKESGQCNPGYERIAREACMSKSTVQQAISRLVKLGRIQVAQGGGSVSNGYTLCLQPLGSIGIPSSGTVSSLNMHHTESRVTTIPNVGTEPISKPIKKQETNELISSNKSMSPLSPIGEETEEQEQRQEQEQEQRQQQRHGGKTPEPPVDDTVSRSHGKKEAEQILSVWKKLTSKPGFISDFSRLLENGHTPDYIEAVLYWAFTTSKYMASESPSWVKGSFDIKSSGVFVKGFARTSAAYESYMASVRAEQEEKSSNDSRFATSNQSSGQPSPDEIEAFIKSGDSGDGWPQTPSQEIYGLKRKLFKQWATDEQIEELFRQWSIDQVQSGLERIVSNKVWFEKVTSLETFRQRMSVLMDDDENELFSTEFRDVECEDSDSDNGSAGRRKEAEEF